MIGVEAAMQDRPAGVRRVTVWVAIAVIVGMAALGCRGPSDDEERASRPVPDGVLADAEWVHDGVTWSWSIPVEAGDRWPGPGSLRAGWMPGVDEASAGTENGQNRSAPLERIELEVGATVPAKGRLVAPRTRGSSRTPRLVMWILADTLRADVAERELSFRDRFDEGLRFRQAFAPATWTLPSVASMFTGRTPASLRGPDGGLIVLPSVVPTLAERARGAGFVTIAVIANPTVNHDNGFSRGFDRFTVPSYSGGWELPDATWVEEQALSELDALPDDDVFLLVHFMDAHDPYRNHENETRFVPPPSGPQAEALSPDELAAMWRAYLSEARYLDGVLQRLWEAVEQRRAIDLAVFTADHGEEFLDHGGTRHGPTVLPEVARVPLWIGGAESGALARRLRAEGVGPGTPTTLLDVGTLLLEPERWMPSGAATVESQVHGPPRFAWIDGAQYWSVASRWLTQREPEDGIEAWLRSQPALRRDPREDPPDADDANPRPAPGSWGQLPDTAWLDLVGQLSGHAAGRWVFFRATGPIPALADLDLGPSSWAFGSCANPSLDPALPCLAYLGPDLPSPFDHRPQQSRWVLDERPDRLPPVGAVSWVEAGRDRSVPQDVSKTIERLRALGYIQ